MKTIITVLFFLFALSSNAQNIEIKDSCYIFIPNNLSRNDDDELVIKSNCALKEFKCQIFDRWGELMYETTNFSDPLDFNLNEKIIVENKEVYKYEKSKTYYVVVSYLTNTNTEKMIKVGRIMIL